MKKIFESIYLFSKLTTSLVLFATLIIMGYFFYKSYQNQGKVYLQTKGQESIFEEKINISYVLIKTSKNYETYNQIKSININAY